MVNKQKETAVVKIDSSLMEKIEEYIGKEENRYRFANKKQFIDLAVYEYLKNLNKKEGK